MRWRRWFAAGVGLAVLLATVFAIRSGFVQPADDALNVPTGNNADGLASDDGHPDSERPDDELPAGDSEPRFLYPTEDLRVFRSRMESVGPYYQTGDAEHGGPWSPGDGQRSVSLAQDFLGDPEASYWVQESLPFSEGDAWPDDMTHVRPLNAAWVLLTQLEHSERDRLREEVQRWLLFHATHPSHDFSDDSSYPVGFPGFAANPIFDHAHWMTRLIKARDMLGRESFSAAENSTLDNWLYDYANWTFSWLHQEHLGKLLPGREERDYRQMDVSGDASSSSYDDGPPIGTMAKAYTNRHAAVASAASLAANYLEFHEYEGPEGRTPPAYGWFTVDELLLHSQLFFEETIRFSVFPEGFQGDFERGDRERYSSASPQQGWLYSVNVLANLAEMADYHARRGDLSLWQYGTTDGFDGTAGRPVDGDFEQKSLHFFAWSMSRYVNDEWGRTNRGEPIALPDFYHDVLPAAIVARFAPEDQLLRDAWRRSGSGFAPYASSPQSQGVWHAHLGEGAKMIGLIEQAGP